ncbi:MAG: leucine-rich repeat protein [Clostridia bacterium]|nr:leucine-rich repeat protein [Clostridia bacterium]
MPYKLEEIGDGAFSGCKNLEPVSFGPNIKILGEQAFLGCEKYETVEIPNTVEFLGRFCFAENKNLKAIIMPNNDTFEISGSIIENPEVVIGVYYDSYAYKQLVPLNNDTPIITNKNKIMIIPVVTRSNLKKTPKIKEIKNTMSIGFDENIEDFVDIDIDGTGAISYKVIVNSNSELRDLKEGLNTVQYEIQYYLSDIDVSEIKTKVTKVDSIEEVYEADSTRDDYSRFFVEATKYITLGSIKINVENHVSDVSKKSTQLTEKYSRLLNETIHKAYMTSYTDGSFKPNVTLSRGEVAVILARINNYNEASYYPNDFEDVPDTSWAKSAIGFVSSKGIMNGSEGKFRMADKITRAEFVIAIAKMIGLEESEDKSEYPDV